MTFRLTKNHTYNLPNKRPNFKSLYTLYRYLFDAKKELDHDHIKFFQSETFRRFFKCIRVQDGSIVYIYCSIAILHNSL